MQQTKNTRTIEIAVNKRPVSLVVEQGRPEMTGTQIKATAIAQGVAIQLDFPLYHVRGQELDPVGDGEMIVLHSHQQFRAVAPDDNS